MVEILRIAGHGPARVFKVAHPGRSMKDDDGLVCEIEGVAGVLMVNRAGCIADLEVRLSSNFEAATDSVLDCLSESGYAFAEQKKPGVGALRSGESGFTLIETFVVLLILAIAAIVAFVIWSLGT